jgi:hypothetical protein
MIEADALGSIGADHLFARLPRDTAESLTAEQRAAIRRAADERIWTYNHPINVRLGLPLPFGRVFVSIVAGRERRNAVRRQSERLANPLATRGNLALLAAAVGILIIAGIAGALVFLAILGT